ncbi:MAG: type I secretion protein TolC [Alphaproteobacteria bacterium]|nr:MAG: type I secretion protein TolC [Alphaproteobacteria bacterium]
MKKSFAFHLLLGIGLILPVSAHAETLQEAMLDAYKQNPTLQAKRVELRAVDETLAEALSGYRPTVSLDANAGISKSDSNSSSLTSSNDDTLTPRAAALTVVQPLFRGGRTVAATNRAEFDIQSTRAELHQTEQQILLSAVAAYMDVLHDRAVVELNQNNQNVLERQLKATEDRFTVGELSRTDVSQAESRVERAKAGVITAQGQVATSQARYERIVGHLPGPEINHPVALTGLPASRQEAIEQAEKNNPQIQSAIFREKSAKESVDEIRGLELPEVSLTGSVSSSWEQFRDGDQTDESSALVQLSFPFYQGGAVMARTRAAGEVANQRRLQLTEANRAVAELAGSAWDDLATARANIEAYQASIKAAEIALEGVKQEQEVGSRTVLDVLDAEQELLDARVSLVLAQRNEVIASYALLAAVGRLTAQDLKLTDEIYDPMQHYKNTRTRWFGY